MRSVTCNSVASILDIAKHANVSSENVLRVVHGEPVSDEVARRVAEAIEALGPPPYPYPRSPVDVLPAQASTSVERRNDELLERFAQAAAELEASLPQGVSSVVYEALRVEVRPVAQHVAEMGALFEQMIRRLEQVGSEVGNERRDRLEDLALLTDLISSGWRGVDRRLGRLERMIERLEAKQNGESPGRVIRLEEHQGRTPSD